jgi:Holliday junction resolvase RusA-like endonuclease
VAARRSAEYKAWIGEAVAEIQSQNLQPVAPPYSVYISALRWRANADLDNILKPCLDMLEHAGLIKNDKHVHEIQMLWLRDGDFSPPPKGCVGIHVETVSD